MEWESRSCNGRTIEGSSVGAAFYGEKGTLVLDGSNAYKIYDLDNKLLKDVKNDISIKIHSTVSPSQALDALHIQNFLKGIREGVSLNAEIEKGYRSTLLILLGNIAFRTGNVSFNTNPQDGHILDNDIANKYWSRRYQPGWEPSV